MPRERPQRGVYELCWRLLTLRALCEVTKVGYFPPLPQNTLYQRKLDEHVVVESLPD